MDRIIVMRTGAFCRSLCVEKDVTVEEINAFDSFSGTDQGWKISKEPQFATGHPNPCVCDQDPDRLHYLQDC